ncbi:hypothetical protein [Mesomycoplasma ovipneumoniae]|uniref:hypothetical protein n=1 Tax=Mesomycoplasma ovipneumoniae TaxID=29562 RepID=UPI0030807BB6
MSKVVLPKIIEQEIKKIIRRRKWKAFLRILDIITFPIQLVFQLVFFIIVFVLYDLLAPFLLRGAQIILWFIGIGAIGGGIIYLITWLASL